MSSDISLPNLLCEEEDYDSSLNHQQLKPFKPSSDDDYYIQTLIQQETMSNECFSYVNNDDGGTEWFKCARLDAINWIFSNREILGFHFRTAYLSLAYFDRFNSKRLIDNGKEWAIQLLCIACLSLAAKMEEQIVPSLSHYKAQGYAFESSVIQRMELMVLTTLDWKMCFVTPFVYLDHFFYKICDECECNELLVSKAIGLILDFSKEVNLMDHRPSIVAMAAVLLACDDQLTRNTLEFKISVVSSSFQSLEKASVIYKCYNLLKEIEVKKNNTPEPMSSFGLLRKNWSPNTNGIKRKLTYNGLEPNCRSQKISRRL
ncbi:cyclin, C-terminal domain-containing protein [Tanacetum coccineum]|uniref:Cyclin, C-terminal domain-containing protein n=1 Tax=Tanacetum coccineum TaxID=301880 RepID=A0ABQ4Y150_9ASTR